MRLFLKLLKDYTEEVQGHYKFSEILAGFELFLL